MMSNETQQFGWTSLYEQIADKLLEYKDRRDDLFAYVKSLTEEFGFDYMHNLDEIDPFTVMGMFNRRILDEKRIAIVKKLADFLGVPVEEAHLSDFGEAVPILFPSGSHFFGKKKQRKEWHGDALWNLFEAALQFSKNDDDETKQKFCETYDKVRKQPAVDNGKISMGLYWIRPNHYLTLDNPSRRYIANELGFVIDRKVFGSTDYLEMRDKLKENFQKPDYPVHSFPELSYKAYQRKREYKSNPDPQPDKRSKTAREQTETYKPEPYGIGNIVDEGCFVEREKLQRILKRGEVKKNIILQGPPGTGKTWLAKRLAYALIGYKDKDKLKVMQFHPNLSYEDFVRGWRPSGDEKLKLTAGPFMEMINRTKEDSDSDYVFVIEEINRGHPAQIFGEMLTLLENDKRESDEAMTLSYGDGEVYVPENLYVIGTMNVADRSLALVDLALRRRFSFFDLEPCFNEKWMDWVHKKAGIDKAFLEEVSGRLEDLNNKIENDPSLGPQFKIGHSYFTPSGRIDNPQEWYKDVIETEIYPLLKEYWFDNLEQADEAKAELLKDF